MRSAGRSYQRPISPTWPAIFARDLDARRSSRRDDRRQPRVRSVGTRARQRVFGRRGSSRCQSVDPTTGRRRDPGPRDRRSSRWGRQRRALAIPRRRARCAAIATRDHLGRLKSSQANQCRWSNASRTGDASSSRAPPYYRFGRVITSAWSMSPPGAKKLLASRDSSARIWSLGFGSSRTLRPISPRSSTIRSYR